MSAPVLPFPLIIHGTRLALSPGSRLGPYEILSALGTGGMGEVYKARDTRLDRTVAIKILPETLAADPQFRERFDREARAISRLTHPYICTLYDVGEQQGTAFLVMEHLEGETLADRLKKGALPLGDALKVAIEIADALSTAHRHGIVHRDLKPGNVMLTKAGAKLLDFGLAKASGPTIAATGLSMLPTTPPNLTAQGTILGTLQYMAPEQIEGLEADARTDIFAFGALVFEMFTGRTAFEGKTRASLLGAILKDEPPALSRIQPSVPHVLSRIISTCLAKEPDDRYQSARDLLRELKWVASESSDGAAAPSVTRPGRSNRVAWTIGAVTAIALTATALIAVRRAGEIVPAAGPAQFTIAPPEKTLFGGPPSAGSGYATQVAISPDGRNIVFVAGAEGGHQIWVRAVATLAARPISGTEGGAFPFWSPDSRFIGFFAGGKLKKVQITGGPPIVLSDALAGRGGSWSRNDVILFAPSITGGLLRVSSAGGVASSVTTLDPAIGETNHRWPYFLPDGRHFIYTASNGTCCPAAKPAVIRVGSLDPTEDAITVFQAESSVLYGSGHLLFARDGTLMAQPFDPDARQTKGDPFPLAEHVSTEGSRYVGASVSANGTLVYGGGGSLAGQELTWFDRAGRALATVGPSAQYVNLVLSPDERRVAVALVSGTPENVDIWIIDIARGVRSRLTIDPGTDTWPVWSPDGTRVAFASQRSGKISLRQRLINGTTPDELLLEGSGDITPTGWSPDGRFITYTDRSSARSDVWVLPLFGDRKPFSLAQTDFTEISGVFSPDGRWIAYASDEDGQPNVFVQRFPGTVERHRVSRDGGRDPVWRADGKEFFYLRADGTLMAVPTDATGEFDAGMPQALFSTGAATVFLPGQVYAPTKDGKRFLVNTRPGESNVAPLTVVIDWTATIQK